VIRLFIVVAIILIAVLANRLLRNRLSVAPTQAGPEMPTQIDRTDFAHPASEWLVLAFTSATCTTCADIERKARVLESQSVAVDVCEFTAQRELHKKYEIDAVPTLLIVDRDGVVQKGFLGPASATDIWAALARVRDGVIHPHDESCS
jgi:thioredoxin-related protein